MSCGDYATPQEWFLAHSVSVFPIRAGTKTPACASWDDYQAVSAQAARWSSYGVVLGTLAVVDTDDPESEHWVARYCPETPFVVVTARGLHRYYRQRCPSPKYIHRDGLTVEHRNVGQYVIGPGSTHPSGLVYRARDWSWDWRDVPFFPASFDFDDRPQHERASEVGARFRLPPVIRAGERHDELFRLLRSLVARGVRTDDAIRLVLHVNQTHCQPPVDEAELTRYARRVARVRDRATFTRVDGAVGVDLASGLLDVGLDVDQVIQLVRSVTPDFDDPRAGRPAHVKETR